MKKTILALSIIGIVSLTAADLFAWGRGSGNCGDSGYNRSGYHMGNGDSYMGGNGRWNREKRNSNYEKNMNRSNMDSSGYENSRYNFKNSKPEGDI